MSDRNLALTSPHMRGDDVDLREEFVVCGAAGYPDPYRPFPNTLEKARQFAAEHSGPGPSGRAYTPFIKRRFVSAWRLEAPNV